MKKNVVKIFFLLFVLVASINSIIFASTLNLKIDTNKEKIKKGEEVNVTVSWSEGMQAADFSLKYDTNKLEYINCDLEEVFINNNIEAGEIKTAWFSMDNEDKTKITYTFKAKKSGKAEFETITNGGFATGNLEIPSQYNEAKSTISISNNLVVYIVAIIILITIILIARGDKKMKKIANKVLVVLTLLAIILTIFPKLFLSVFATDVLYGDCNLDGKINNRDLGIIQKHIKGIVNFDEKQFKNADLDNSGSINNGDVSILYKIITLGYEIELPVKYGDIDNNGVIDTADVALMSQYIEGSIEFTKQQQTCADMNVDDVVDKYDLKILKQYTEEYGSDNGENIKSVIYGDINNDGKINNIDLGALQKYVKDAEVLPFKEQLKADLNLDGKVNNIDINILELYINEDIKELPIVCGDINLNGKINNVDLGLMAKYLKNKGLLTKEQLLASDLNADSIVNYIDYEIFKRYLADLEGYETLPFTEDIDVEEGDITISILYGDANCDGIINNEDIIAIKNNQDAISDEGILNADVNLDEKVNLLDGDLINLYLEDKVLLPIEYGDINSDNRVDTEDINLIKQHIEGTKEFTVQQEICADVNVDGTVNYYDINLLSKYNVEIMRLPFIMGDINLDGRLNNKDLGIYQQSYLGMIQLSEEQKILGDINSDGIINDVDIQVLLAYLNEDINSLPIVYGDVDENGKLDDKDEAIIKNYINDIEELDKVELYIADVNIDGNVNDRDLGLIQRSLKGEITLPQTFIKNETITKETKGNKEILKGFNIGENGIVASEVMTNFTDNVEVIVYNEKQQELENNATVGTGDIVEGYYDVNELPNQEYVIVIYGDTNGDGLISPLDALAIIKNKNNKVLFSNEFCEEAGRILDRDGAEEPSAVDALAIIKHLNGRYLIDQNK